MGIPSNVSNDTVFVGGFSFSLEDYPNGIYWGTLGDYIFWSPKFGTFSSNQDKACEVLAATLGLKQVTYVDDSQHDCSKPTCEYSSWLYKLSLLLMKAYNMGCIDGFSKPKVVSPECKVNFVTYSAGSGAVMQLLVFAHYHRIGLIKEKVRKGDKLTTEEIYLMESVKDSSEDKYRIMFYDNDGKPLAFGPDCVGKIVYISPLAGGIEYTRSAACIDADDLSFTSFGLGWLWCWGAILLDRILKLVPFALVDLYLSQFCTLSAFPGGVDTGIHSQIEPLAKQLTLESELVIKLYNIQCIRVYTKSCVKIGEVYFPRPDLSLFTIPTLLAGCGWRNDAKYGEQYSQCLSEHDGTVTLCSQKYGHKCRCDKLKEITLDIKVCTNCGCIHTNLDHLGIMSKNCTSLVAHELILNFLSSDPPVLQKREKFIKV